MKHPHHPTFGVPARSNVKRRLSQFEALERHIDRPAACIYVEYIPFRGPVDDHGSVAGLCLFNIVMMVYRLLQDYWDTAGCCTTMATCMQYRAH